MRHISTHTHFLTTSSPCHTHACTHACTHAYTHACTHTHTHTHTHMQDKDCPLGVASKMGHLQTVKKLLEYQAHINHQDEVKIM